MTLDTFVGFEKEPENLVEFLAKEGYTSVDRVEDCTIYTRKDNPWPQVFYYLSARKAEELEEVPNWEKSGFKIVSELNINYPIESDAIDEAERLSVEITRRLNGILYDINLDEYFTKDDI